MPQTKRLDMLELQILLAVSALQPVTASALEGRMVAEIGRARIGAVFIKAFRMDAMGLLEVTHAPREEGQMGRLKNLYSLTPAGQELLDSTWKALERLGNKK